MLQFLFWLSQQLNLVFIIAISVLVVGIIGQRSIYQIQRQIRIRKEAEEKMRLYAKDIEIAKIEIEKQKDQLLGLSACALFGIDPATRKQVRRQGL